MKYEQDSRLKPEKGKEDNNVQDGKEQGTEESFSFLKETIKPKTISREKIFMQLVRMAVYGLIIGMFACCSFFALKPWAEHAFKADSEKVTIPNDEEPKPKEDTLEAQTDAPEQTLDAESYRQMMDNLYLTAQEAKKAVVSVRAGTKTDWTEVIDKTNPNLSGSSGVIAADNGRELLILADNAVCEGTTEWEVVFADGSSQKATLKKQDKNRGLAVFSVPESAVSESTWNRVKVAELGNSNLVTQGEIVIGLGNLFGYEEGLGYGVVSSVEYSEVLSDGHCRVIATDMTIAQSGTGILVNQDGDVIGLIRQGVLEEHDGETAANALAISDLKDVMELLLNGESVPYAGIYGVAVSTTVSEEQEIPEGLYVTQVESDSPAMNAGIQNGDVIQFVNGELVTGIDSFEAALLECTVGDLVKVQGQRRGSGGYVNVNFTLNVGSRE